MSRICWIVALCIFRMPLSLFAQGDFEKARDVYLKFWTEASSWPPTSDEGEREARLQRGRGLSDLLEEPIKGAILSYLNGSAQPSAAELRLKLATALTPSTLGDEIVENSVDVVSTDNGGRLYIVYDVNYCASCSKSWLGEFTKSDGTFRLQSAVKNPLVDDTVHLALLRPVSSPPILALYGLHWGDAHNREDLKIFAVDGELHEQWSKLDMPQGAVSITGSEVRLTFLSALTGDSDEIKESYKWDGTEMRRIDRSIAPGAR